MTSTSFEARRRSERLDRVTIQRQQLQRFNELLDQILPQNSFYAQKLSGIQRPVRSLDDFACLPLTTKAELLPASPSSPANHLTFARSQYVRFHRTSGTHGHPLAILDTHADWRWWIDVWQYVLDAANVTAEDIAGMAFSFGPFIGFWSANDALIERGSLVVPCGGLSTVARLQMILQQRVTVLCCTPSYALHLAAVAKQESISLSDAAVRSIIVAGEPGGSIPTVWQRIESAWNAQVVDHAGATEIGPWGYAAPDHRGLYVIESEFIPEFLAVNSQLAAQPGELSELVLTSLGRVGAPIIRYRTGDLVRTPNRLSESNKNTPAGFTLLEGGVLGRVDDMMIVRGVNVYPSAVEQIIREFPTIEEYRLIVTKQGEMDALLVEVEGSTADAEDLAKAIKIRLGLHVNVQVVAENSLPRFELKGKRFVDRR